MDLHVERGILVAAVGNLTTLPGVLDVYDVETDCRAPRLLSSVNLGGLLGHEGSLSPDGLTYYVGSTGGNTLTAVDLTDPRLPKAIAVVNIASHGLSVSADGNTLYDTVTSGPEKGMVTFDVSAIQARRLPAVLTPGAGFVKLSSVSWDDISIPQSTIPVTIRGKSYVIESDEFSSGAAIGASRIFDVSDPRAPQQISQLRLQVHEPENAGKVAGDTKALIGGPYSGHFCSVPQLVEPGIVACSMLRSGVRVFDIRDPAKPEEIAYFSPPAPFDSLADGRGRCSCLHTGSTVAFVPERGEMWVSGQESGFHVVRFTNGVWPAFRTVTTPPAAAPPAAAPPAAAPPAAAPPAAAAAPAPVAAPAAPPTIRARGGTLPETGLPAALGLAALVLLGIAALGSRRSRTD